MNRRIRSQSTSTIAIDRSSGSFSSQTMAFSRGSSSSSSHVDRKSVMSGADTVRADPVVIPRPRHRRHQSDSTMDHAKIKSFVTSPIRDLISTRLSSQRFQEASEPDSMHKCGEEAFHVRRSFSREERSRRLEFLNAKDVIEGLQRSFDEDDHTHVIFKQEAHNGDESDSMSRTLLSEIVRGE